MVLNFSVAARDLCLTHSAVSHQIRLLENWFGQPLFTRHSGGVALTPAGQQLQRSASQSLGMLEDACSQLLSSANGQSIKLAAPGSFMALWLIRRLEHFERTHPDLRLQLQTQGDYQDLLSQRVDALVVSASPPWPKGVQAVTLFRDCAGPVCSPDWLPLPRNAGEILEMPLLYTLSRREAWVEWGELHGLDPARLNLVRHFDNLQLMLEAAVARLGIAIAPEQLVQRDLQEGRLVAPLGFSAGHSEFALCMLATRKHDAALAALGSWMVEQVQ